MQERELVLRTLRLNLIPALRVIAPGPATRFPVTLMKASGEEVVVGSLREARAMASAASAADPAEAAFFVEGLPAAELRRLKVSGYSVSPSTCEPGLAELAVKAAYCLGFRDSDVTVGIGPAGPLVLDVREAGDAAVACGQPQLAEPAPGFLGARAEYLTIDPVTGEPEHAFHTLDIVPGRGRPTFPDPICDQGFIWVSSPMPFLEMPLTTRLLFAGKPDPQFVRLLDYIVAILGMLVSPAEEARQRHATEEGLLGSIRRVGQVPGTTLPAAGAARHAFEYLCVPSLLWDLPAIQGIVSVASAIAAHSDAVLRSDGPWKGGLEARYQVQRAYYHGDKGFFIHVLRDVSRALLSLPLESGAVGRIQALLGTCESAVSRQRVVVASPGLRDFRPAWGISVAERQVRHISVGPGDLPESFLVRAGVREAELPPGNVVLHDPTFEGSLPSWASLPGVHAVRLNPCMSQDMSLPADMAYRAALGPPQPAPSDHRDARLTQSARSLTIGPVLSIIAPLEEGPRRFGIETDRFREILRIAAAQGILAYVFFPADEQGETDDNRDARGTMQGWLYRERKSWFKSRVPVPDVVYDRHIPDILPTGAIRDVAREFQERHPATQFVNSLEMVRACRDKLATHSLLSQDPFIAGYLPETILAEDAASVIRFASQRRHTYLKLRGGTGSRGLVLIESCGGPGTHTATPGSFKVSRREKDGTVAQSAAAGSGELVRLLQDILHPGQGPTPEYIAQHGIDLVRTPEAGEVFEVRVICQKGGAGTWLRTGMVCRFNPALGRFIVPREELHVRVDDLLGQVFPGRVTRIKEEIRELARRIPPLLERASGRGGEMSVDLGIDTAGNPWLIEVNSKPATLFRDIAAFELRELSLRRVVNYSMRLFESRELPGSHESQGQP